MFITILKPVVYNFNSCKKILGFFCVFVFLGCRGASILWYGCDHLCSYTADYGSI